jgi:hypothetical protein
VPHSPSGNISKKITQNQKLKTPPSAVASVNNSKNQLKAKNSELKTPPPAVAPPAAPAFMAFRQRHCVRCTPNAARCYRHPKFLNIFERFRMFRISF